MEATTCLPPAETQTRTGGRADLTVRIAKAVLRPRTRVAVVIPAHNEAADIASTLHSLADQDCPPERVVVVCDNCTDATEQTALMVGYRLRNAVRVEVIRTVNNTARKAGTLNQGIAHIRRSGQPPEFLFTMDADTELDRNFFTRALGIMRDAAIGGLSVTCQGKTGIGKTPWQKMLAALQRIEYGRYAVTRIRHNVHTMSGAGSLYRYSAIADLIDVRGVAFDEASIVEDYAATLDMRSLGWRAGSNMLCTASTDIMPTYAQLKAQRVRWITGTVDELRRRGWNRHTWQSIATMILGTLTNLAMMAWITGSLVVAALASFSGQEVFDEWWWIWSAPWLAYHIYPIWHLGWRAVVFELLIVPRLVYTTVMNWWIVSVAIRSYARSARNVLSKRRAPESASTTMRWE